VFEEAAQLLRHGDHPLSHGHRRDDVIDEMGGGLLHVPAIAGWAHPAPLARERDDKPLAAARAESTAEPDPEELGLRGVAAGGLVDLAQDGGELPAGVFEGLGFFESAAHGRDP